MVDDGIDIIRTAEKYYRSKDTVAKQRIVSSIYPNKLVFDKTGYRTPENLKFVNLLCRVDKAFKGNKKGKKTEISVSSLEVESEGFEPSSKQGINKLSTSLDGI